VFLNSIELDVAKQAFGNGGKVCLQLESPSSISFESLSEKLVAVAPNIVASSSGDGIEVGDETITFKCPFSLCLINYPGRGKKCSHAQCFDLEVSLSG
jgi:hypothetical protein